MLAKECVARDRRRCVAGKEEVVCGVWRTEWVEAIGCH